MENQKHKFEQEEFNPEYLVNLITNLGEPEIFAKALDKAMLFCIKYVDELKKHSTTEESFFDTYYFLRKMRNAILDGSNNIYLE